MSPLAAVGRGQRVWDVANAEAHVRATLDAGLLKLNNARLSPKQYDRCLQFLRDRFWQLSGLEADWKTLRYVWELNGFTAPRSAAGEFEPIRPLQFAKKETAERAVELLEKRGHKLFLASITLARPRSAYDPSFGQAFSTYSRRLLTLQIADWYRTDEEFGDTRYAANRGRPESLEALAERQHQEQDGRENGDRYMPGGRLEIVDELNRHAYQESLEEVLMRETASG